MYTAKTVNHAHDTLIVATKRSLFPENCSLAMGQTESVPAEEEQPLSVEAVESEQIYPSALVIVGPSGVGKGTLIQKLMEGRPEFGFSCSHTTRAPRAGEQVVCSKGSILYQAVSE